MEQTNNTDYPKCPAPAQTAWHPHSSDTYAPAHTAIQMPPEYSHLKLEPGDEDEEFEGSKATRLWRKFKGKCNPDHVALWIIILLLVAFAAGLLYVIQFDRK
ncbi:hypothetical protein P175DRAFT_0503143 [Aspergillus ochraceoroseus IBT 24754]|uniref:Uncharacterized protein n=1 Tax=Aspergillus ochraceoroseus IBT 24754 TaxID=1392256 RepID=A0A2T5LTK8_9EURO|nr:uncharacterized protein P175DRAFT_0503143 [Aspergillus ochraceoroseus IBT 24754]PTU19607.1 hypothetical protein P175DRAFT_0503143 [Aspergillus ochraceoroseus IBT 24754]